MSTLREELEGTLAGLREAGLYKEEWEIETPQSAHVRVGGRDVLNLCANNYLGLASHPAVIEAAHAALDRWGFGMASVRFICGTQSIHRELERRISEFLGTEDTILYSSCFDANAGLFEALLDGRGRRHLRRAEPRLGDRRHPPVQGAPPPVPKRRHGRPRAVPDRGGRTPATG